MQLDIKGKKVLACPCEEQAASQNSPLLPQSISPAWSPWLLSLDFFPSPSKLPGCCAASMVPALSVPRDPVEGQGLPGKGWRGSSATWLGALGDQHGLLAALELTILQACCGWGRQGAPLHQQLLSLCCIKQYQGCCLHPLALSCGFSGCWGKSVLGLAVRLAYLWGVRGMKAGEPGRAEQLLHLLQWGGGSALAV